MKLYVHADAVFAKSFGAGHPVRGSLMSNIATLELQRENWDAALAAYRQALSIVEATEGPDAVNAAGLHADIARALAEQGHKPDAFTEIRRCIEILEKAGPAGEPRLIGYLAELAEYQVTWGQPAEALATAERSLAITKKRPADANPGELGSLKFVIARALWDLNKDKKRAHALVLESLEVSKNPDQRAVYQKWLAEHPL
jgi:tetratricopeptide (TPR) repeat protein